MNKWTSRKFWVTIVAGAVGIITAIWGGLAGGKVETIAGLIITALVALGYLTAEAVVDSARARSAADIEAAKAYSSSKKK
jgi:hypothetical protein